LRDLQHRLRLAIQPDIIDRTVIEERRYVKGWQNVEITFEELIHSIQRGHAYCSQVEGYRDADHFLASDVASVDVDKGLAIEDALRNPLVRNSGTFLYTTVRHRAEAPRFRIVFVLLRTITDSREMAALSRALCLRLRGDPSVVDAAHFSFGNRSAEVTLLGNGLCASLLNELILQGLEAPQPDTVRRGEKHRVPSRSRLTLAPGLEIRLANGQTTTFGEVDARTSIHCPFHHDEHPSAFVVTNRAGINGVYCSTCGCSYWPENSRAPPIDGIRLFTEAAHSNRVSSNQISVSGKRNFAGLRLGAEVMVRMLPSDL
jgi:hypothetical protein